jgi:hypothetical protein
MDDVEVALALPPGAQGARTTGQACVRNRRTAAAQDHVEAGRECIMIRELHTERVDPA